MFLLNYPGYNSRSKTIHNIGTVQSDEFRAFVQSLTHSNIHSFIHPFIRPFSPSSLKHMTALSLSPLSLSLSLFPFLKRPYFHLRPPPPSHSTPLFPGFPFRSHLTWPGDWTDPSAALSYYLATAHGGVGRGGGLWKTGEPLKSRTSILFGVLSPTGISCWSPILLFLPAYSGKELAFRLKDYNFQVRN